MEKFGLNDYLKRFNKSISKIERKFEGIFELYVAETITARLTQPCILSKAELQVIFCKFLKHNFSLIIFK